MLASRDIISNLSDSFSNTMVKAVDRADLEKLPPEKLPEITLNRRRPRARAR